MTTPRVQEASQLRGKLSGASPAISTAIDIVERLSAATFGTVVGALGGAAGLMLAFATGVAAPAFASAYFLAGGFVFGASSGVLASRWFGPAALRRKRENVLTEIELRREGARFLIETWKQLPAKPPQALVQQIGDEIGKTLTLPNFSITTPGLPPPVASPSALPPPSPPPSDEQIDLPQR